jgi:hypothetical protein
MDDNSRNGSPPGTTSMPRDQQLLILLQNSGSKIQRAMRMAATSLEDTRNLWLGTIGHPSERRIRPFE